jgi:predicted nucleic acid-binding protein
LPFVPERAIGAAELLLDTCVYIDLLQGRAPASVKNLLESHLSNHSGVALAELTCLFGRLDPRDSRTAGVLRGILRAISAMPDHRLSAPSAKVLGEAGILAGIVERLAGFERRNGQALLNDAVLYLQAIEHGQTVLTRNIREFDWFDQLLPGSRVLFDRQA